jgi:hypothetical protein
MTAICDRVNADDSLDDVKMDDEAPQALCQGAPVLSFPVALFTAGLAIEEAMDN